MVRRKIMGLLVCSLVVSLATVAWAGIPDMTLTVAAKANGTVLVSVYTLPNGGGHGLNDCYISGGVKVDATVTLTLNDGNGDPIFNYPFEDMWMETSPTVPGLVLCPGGSVADLNTDINGQTTFSGAVFGGGASATGDVTIIVVNGEVVVSGSLNIQFNSPDINGDLTVNLTDVVLFAGAFYGAYSYSADFYFDGTLNLSDIVLLAQGNGTSCP